MKYSMAPGTITSSIPKEAEELHFVRPPRIKSLKAMLRKCRNLRRISLSESCSERLAEKAKKLLRKREIGMSVSSNHGRPIAMEIAKIQEVIGLQKDEKSYREIEGITGIPKSTVHYLIKYAGRGKVRNGKNIVYLE